MIEIIPNFHPAIVHFPIAFATAALAFTAVSAVRCASCGLHG